MLSPFCHRHFLGVAASWLVQVGIECYRCVRDIVKSENEREDVDIVVYKGERAKVLGLVEEDLLFVMRVLRPLFSLKITSLACEPHIALTTIRSFLLYYLPLLQPKVEDDDNEFLPDDERHVDLVVPFKKSVKQILREIALTTIRSFLLYYLPLLQPKVEDDDNEFLPDDERHVDLVVPFKKSVKQILRETSVVTTRRVLERFAVHYFCQRAAWKLLKEQHLEATF
nr:protein SYM-1 like [Tanacetum cinerariifolium]